MTNSVLVCNKCQNEFAVDARVQQLPPVSYVLLRLNAPPSQTESRQELLYLEREECELQRYNQEITRLQQALGQLEVQRRALLERMECRRSWIAPIRRLPAEVLEEIFDIVCQPYSLEISFYQKPGERARTMTLSHVAYQWRRIIGRCARLWSRISINVGASNSRRFIKSLLGLYLTNSAEYPLVFELVGDVDHDDDHNSYSRYSYDSVIDELSPHCRRLESFVLGIQSKHGRTYTRPRGNLTLPSSLRYFENSGEWEDTAEWFSQALRGAPKLTTVKSYEFIGEDSLSYHQLITLKLSLIVARHYSDLVTALRHSTSLQSLKIGFTSEFYYRDDPLDIDPHMHPNFTLPCLDHLSFSNDTDHPLLTHFLRQVTLPSLRVLHTNPGKQELSLTPVCDLIRRSGCQLIEFSLNSTGPFSPKAEFLDLFRLSPELLRIEVFVSHRDSRINSQTFTYELLEFMKGTSYGLLVPNLVEMKISDYNSSVNPDYAFALLDMIESRNAHQGDDRTVLWDYDLVFGGLWECSAEVIAAFEARLEALAQNGVKCSIRWARPLKVEEDTNYELSDTNGDVLE
ncbi:hypothetical protein VNI00_010053 [Paramarasmius palmivorus]|uniref:F-box domain-containing protein n=1 Tax=Paramarasmius palmivorus TaxID=297713 RepID=A0AAW0CJR4_9AGAR